MKRVVVLLLFSFFVVGCIGGPEGPAGKPSLLQGQINSKEQFYSDLKLVPTLDYDLLSVYGAEPTMDKGGAIIDYIAISGYASDSGEEYASSVIKLRTGGRIWAKDDLENQEIREIEGKTVYIDTRGGPTGDVEVKWIEGDAIYSVGKAVDGSATKEELVALAGDVITSGEKLDPDAAENEWVLLYQYLPDPLEGEHLFSVKISKLGYTSIQGEYGTEESQFVLTIVPGEVGVSSSGNDITGLSSAEDVQVGGNTATAGYKDREYNIIYADEENQIGMWIRLDKGDLTAVKESMAKTLEAAIAEVTS